MKLPKWIHYAILSLTVMLAIGSCTREAHLHSTPQIPMPENGSKVVTAQNKFAFKIFDLISRANKKNENIMISPLSIHMDLSMVYNGAAGSTKEAMQEALQIKGIDTSTLNKTDAALLQNIPNTDPAVKVDIANAIWYRQTMQPLASFLSLNKKYYQATIRGADFTNAQTVTDINNWVAAKTHQKIQSILDHIKPGDKMFLLNAVYFKGDWTTRFDSKLTKKRPFYTSAETQVQVPFMSRTGRFNYGHNNTLQIVELPYGNGDFSMYVLLPAKNANIKTWISSQTPESFASLTGSMDSTKLQLYLPKWEAAYSIPNLAPQLSTMGMGIAFSQQADFTKMYKAGGSAISQVTHKTYIKVDEKGTEAAAVTSTGITTTAVTPGFPPVMDVNRPFVYLITENTTGSILFLGIVNNPAANAQ